MRIVRGVRGVVIGTDPYCRRCGYNLSGATNGVCSECGAKFSLSGVRIGVHRFQIRPILQGVALLCAIAPMAAINVPRVLQRAVDQRIWYRYFPEKYLLKRAKAGDASCFRELKHRLANDQLSSECIISCSREAIEAFEARDASPVALSWIELLGILADRRLLPEDASDRYYLGVAKIEFDVRSPVESDSSLPGRALIVKRAPKTSTLFWRCRDATTAVDGELRHTHEPVDGRVAGDVASVAYDMQVPLDGIVIGRHVVEHRVTVDVARGPFFEGADPDIVCSRNLQFRREIEIAAIGLAPPVSTINVPSLRAELLDRICANFRVGPLNETTFCRQFDCELVVRPPIPCDLAFDVYLYSGDEEIRIGELVVGQKLCHAFVTRTKPYLLPIAEKGRYGVELRRNPKLATKSVDAWRIWDGVLFLHLKPGREAMK